LGYAEQLLSQGGPDTEGWAALLGIRNAGGRAAKLTQQLLAFSRKQILQPRVLDLHQVVTDMHALLRRLIGEDVALHTQSEPGLGRINADPGQMEQVLMNLAVNARQAMPTGGRLTIELSNVELDQSYSRAHIAVMPGDFVRLTVSDTGCGMDKETQARAFEPFFTTKAEGTGLGLSTVYGIVKQSGGNIWVYSEPGLGTAFKLYFPRVRDARQKRPEPIRSLALFDGTETILVVEDEPEVRALIGEVLSTRGYTILSAADPEEAERLEQDYSGKIDLLLTDMVMPVKSGAALAQALARKRPDMKILFMSGYADPTIAHSPAWKAGSPFIQKPFTPAHLAQRLRELLDRK
jgi:CheY-like chemotaxis protein